MNFGRFFKLNQYTSDVVEGITIFDYTELPAYDGLASDNPSSPKYPVTMTITDNAIRFKMHYCIYRCSEDRQNGTIYGFSIEDIKHKLYRDNPNDHYDQYSLNIAHIEEVILELPFSGYGVNNLTEIIKQSYIASFPQIVKEPNSGTNTLTGNRFLNQLIEQVLSNHNLGTDTISYSTLWLMDLYDENGNINLRSLGKDGLIDKFLRKLLLDFMFDLKHSSLFKVSPRYDQMLSGLMNDYYFSSLMHKCEFFYYRDLIISEVEPIKDGFKDDNRIVNNNDRFTYLYAKELFNAQELWTNDIMNPLSESFFEHDFPLIRNKFSSIIWEKMHDKKWNSWFATPEEEMRRVYFTINEWGKPCYCNSESFAALLSLDNSSDIVIQESLTSLREKREKISRWFLSRYDFNDVFHLHFFKHFNLCFSVALIIFLLHLFIQFKWAKDIIHGSTSFFIRNSSLQSLLILTLFLFIIKVLSWYCFSKKRKEPYKGDNILKWAHYYLYFDKFITFVFDICLIVWGGILLCTLTDILITGNLLLFHLDVPSQKSLCWSIILMIALICFLEPSLVSIVYKTHLLFKPLRPQRIIRNMHIILPKLIASMIAAWLTLSTGHVIMSSFFDIKFTWTLPIIITVMVLSFITSRISRIMPTTSSLFVITRSIELIIISYFIAFIAGFFVINFVGEKYLCQNETFKELKQEINAISKNSCDTVRIVKIKDNIKYKAIRDDNMMQYYVSNKDGSYLFAVKYEKDDPDHDLFIMPEFLKMFSFIAMFIGIFLQMAFFDARQMTDF